MKKLELILITGAIIGLLLVLFNTPFDSLIASVFFTTLSCLYYFFGFALFNNIPALKIFKADSYKGVGTLRILIAIGTGIALSILTTGFMFTILNYLAAKTLLVVGLVFVTIIIILALMRNAQEKNQFYKNIILRCLVFLIIAVTLLLAPGHLFAA